MEHVNFFTGKYGDCRVVISNSVVKSYVTTTVETRAAKWVYSMDIRRTNPATLGTLIHNVMLHMDINPPQDADVVAFDADFIDWTTVLGEWPDNILVGVFR